MTPGKQERAVVVVLTEAVGALAYRATNILYEEQPDLWRMGEHGRNRTQEDFGRHFEALATMDRDLFAAYVAYCRKLFVNHGFPAAWLTDAWRIMAETLQRELHPAAAEEAIKVLRAGTQ